MAETAPEVRFVRALAAGVLREGGEGVAAAAHAALRAALATQKSLVLEVQFTGFARRGEQVGGVHPVFVRAAAQLIVLRVNRLGFTADAEVDDLRALLDLLSRPAAELPADRLVARVAEAAPRGIYLGTSAGEVYRPAAAEPPAAPRTEIPAEAPSRMLEGIVVADSIIELQEFELLDQAPSLPPDAGEGGPSAPPAPVRDEPGADDLYHFFRTSSGGRPPEQEAEALAESLRTAQTVMRFDEAAQSAVAAIPRLLDAGDSLRALGLLDALAAESGRADRSRVFRDSAQGALRRVATEPLLNALAELLPAGGELREQVLRVFLFVRGEAVSVLEAVLFRATDASLREAVFRAMLEVDPENTRLLERVMTEPVAGRARALLELAALPDLDPALTLRWLERTMRHPDASVRADVVRLATRLGGRRGMRIVVELLGDADLAVRRAAAHGLGSLAEPAAVPFLARLLNESGDEELQLEAVASLGRIGTPETLPVLTSVLSRRQLFSGRRLLKLKLAAVGALGRIPLPGARDVLASLAGGRDSDLAAEARRVLAAGDAP